MGAGAIKELEPGEVLVATEEGVTEIAAGVRSEVSDANDMKERMNEQRTICSR